MQKVYKRISKKQQKSNIRNKTNNKNNIWFGGETEKDS